MEAELKALREEIAALRREVAALRAEKVSYLAPQPPVYGVPHWQPNFQPWPWSTCGGDGIDTINGVA